MGGHGAAQAEPDTPGEPRYSGKFVPKASEEAIEKVFEKVGPPAAKPAPQPTIQAVVYSAYKSSDTLAEEPSYSGAYLPKSTAEVDFTKAVDDACHKTCPGAWSKYEACERRIEAKGHGECSGFYMDYLHCVDQCSSKLLFKTLR